MVKKNILVILSIALITFVGFGFFANFSKSTVKPATETTVQPALNVTTIQPSTIDIPLTLSANGSIAAWQEAIIGAEISGFPLKEVLVDVGDHVKKAQVLAVLDDETVLADIAQIKALLAEAEATFAEAQLNADRVRKVMHTGAISAQQVNQYLTVEKTAQAKVASAKAQLNSQSLRQRHTRIVASDDGVISARAATLGAVATPGQELFRLIRQNRLEWRGEMTASEMSQIRVGVSVKVKIPNVGETIGKVRFLAPTLDTQSRNGLVYVDLPEAAAKGLRAGMFAQGEFYLGDMPGLTVPQEALSMREGFSYVFRLIDQAKDHSTNLAKVSQVKVQLGRRTGDRFEIISGVKLDDSLVASGGAFLADGDLVKIVQK